MKIDWENVNRHKKEAMKNRQSLHDKIFAEEFVPKGMYKFKKKRSKVLKGPQSVTPSKPRGLGDD